MIRLNLQFFAKGCMIEYDGKSTDIEINKIAILQCGGKKAKSNIVVTMEESAQGTIAYAGSVTSLSSGQTAVLHCFDIETGGKKLIEDIRVKVDPVETPDVPECQHVYEATDTFNWYGSSYCEMIVSCHNCGSSLAVSADKIESEIITPATCATTGEILYTATFNDYAKTTTKNVLGTETDPNNHDFPDGIDGPLVLGWSDTKDGIHHKGTCAYCGKTIYEEHTFGNICTKCGFDKNS